jgi:hypothetical protein
MKILTKELENLVLEMCEEIDSLIDADDGTVFMIQHIDMVQDIRQLIEAAEEIGNYGIH